MSAEEERDNHWASLVWPSSLMASTDEGKGHAIVPCMITTTEQASEEAEFHAG
jgi:hypothetical protein